MKLKLLSIGCLAWGLTGCNSPPPTAVANPQPPAISSPVRIYVAIDRTASVSASKIPTFKLDKRQQEAQRNSAEFTTKISKVLEQPPNCKASDRR
jgi:hypothetical protein